MVKSVSYQVAAVGKVARHSRDGFSPARMVGYELHGSDMTAALAMCGRLARAGPTTATQGHAMRKD